METEKNSKSGSFWNTHKVWIIPGGIILLGGIAFAIYKKKKQENKVTDYTVNTSGSSGGFRCTSTTYPLNIGTCNKEVSLLQRALVRRGYNLGKTGRSKDGVDGRFGEKTKSVALKAFGKTSFSKSDIQQIVKA